MEYKELISKDRFNVYKDWITIEEAKNRNLIPESLHSVFKDRCECGSERIIKTNLKQYTCCNPYCEIKQAFKLEEIFKRFSVRGLGYASCKSIIEQMTKYIEGTNLFELLQKVPDTKSLYLTHSIEYNLRETIKVMKSKQLTFPEVISIMSIPGLETTALKLFVGIDSYDEFEVILNSYINPKDFFNSRGVNDLNVINNILTSMDEIKSAWEMFKDNSVKTADTTINIVMTGPSKLDGVSRSKNYIIDYFNKLCVDKNGVRQFNIKLGKSLSTSKFFIAQSDNGSTSYRRAKARELEEETRLIYTADEFAAILKNYMDEVNNEKE